MSAPLTNTTNWRLPRTIATSTGRPSAGTSTHVDRGSRGARAIVEAQAGVLWIDWRPNGESPDICVQRLKSALALHRGGKTAVGVRYCAPDSSVCLRLGPNWQVSASRQLLSSLRTLDGVRRVEVVYRRGGPVNM